MVTFILQWGDVPLAPVIRSPEAYAEIWTNRPGPPRNPVDLDHKYSTDFLFLKWNKYFQKNLV